MHRRDRLVRRRCTSRDERGAIIPMVALVLVVLVPSAAIAVDLGMLRVVRRDMQALADVVALDLVRLVDGRTAAQIHGGYNGLPTLTAELAKSVDRNADVLGDPPQVTVKLAFMDPSTHQLETMVDPGGQLLTKEATGAQVPNALEVRAQGGIDFAFAPGRGTPTRTAVAVPAPSTCFRLGSFALSATTGESELLVSTMPGLVNNSTLSATAVGYQGLGALEVDLLDLVGVSSLGVGTPDALLELGGLTLGQFYAAVASAAQANGAPAAEVTLLHQLSTKANLTSHIAIRDILDIAAGDTAALAASFNVLDLVVGAAYAANGSSAIGIPGLAVQLPGLTSLTASLSVLDEPRLACGRVGTTKAQTGQVALSLDTSLDVNETVSQPLLAGSLLVRTRTSTELLLAKAEGTLSSIVCGNATLVSNAEGIDVEVQSSLASTIRTEEGVTITGTLDLRQDVPLLGVIKVATITLDNTFNAIPAETTQGTATGTISFRHPPDEYDTPKSYGSGIVLNHLSPPLATSGGQVHVAFLPGYGSSGLVDVSAVTGLSSLLTNLLTAATSSVNGLVVDQLNGVVTPALARQVGVKVGGADLFALPRPSCNDPALAG